MTKLILLIYVGVALACALISFILLNTLTSKVLMKYYLAMYDGEVVDEVLGEMPDEIKDHFTKGLEKFGRSRIENCKNSIEDYVMMTIISVLPSIIPILNIVLLVEEFKIYHGVVKLYDRAEAYVNREVVD